MKTLLKVLQSTVLLCAVLPVVAEEAKPAPKPATKPTAKPAPAATGALPADYSCLFCHADKEKFFDDTAHLLVTDKDVTVDTHWKKGIRCHDCHGGSPVLDDFVDHRKDDTFHAVTPADIPGFCGRCHSDIQYMRRFTPSPRTDQEAEYWTSGHGQHLKALKPEETPVVATCVSCHDRPHSNGRDRAARGIRPVNDLESPVYPTNVAKTCATCHSKPELMADFKYHGRPIGSAQYDQWKESVHGQALLKKGDLSAPTCNDCHGNHGALPPQVDSVANACGTCHGKVASLFAATRMKHQFEKEGLPGCATCHGSHSIHSPTDEMLGMKGAAVCATCHEEGKQGKFGATAVGAEVALGLRAEMERLKGEIAAAEAKVAQAERLGMEVSGPRFDLHKAQDALTNARSLVHTFAKEPVEEALAEGLKVTSQVNSEAQAALAEHTFRRQWLAASLVPLLVVVVLLVLYIRSLPARP